MQCASQQLGEGFASHLVSSPANFQAKLGEHLSLAGLDWTPCNASALPQRRSTEVPHIGSPVSVAATYTAKAALVLSRTGVPTTTIHRLIYRVYHASDEAIDEMENAISLLMLKLYDNPSLTSLIDRKKRELKDMKSLKVTLNEDSAALDAKLIVIDECSMAGQQIAEDLLSFGKPVLVLGDPGHCASFACVIGTLFQYLPSFAAIFSICWFGVQIAESSTGKEFRAWLSGKRKWRDCTLCNIILLMILSITGVTLLGWEYTHLLVH